MPDMERAVEALKKADAAGNTQDARKIAQAIKQMQAQEQTPIGGAISAVGEGLKTAGQAIGEGAQFLYEEARGPEGLPDLPEITDIAPPTMGSSATVAAGLMAATTPEQQRDIVLEHYPGAEIEEVEADGKTYQIVNYTDPEGEQHRAYVNAPGLSFTDVTRTAGQALAYTPAARAGKGLGLLNRAARVGGGSAVTSAGLDLAAQQAGADEGVSYTRSGIAGGVGAGLEFLSPVAAKVWRAMRGQSRYFNTKTGKLTDEGVETARKAGLSDEDIADLDAQAAREFAKFPEGGGSPETAARVTQAKEFDIPLSRGQSSRDYTQLNTEERMRKGLLGQAPRETMERLERQQSERVAGAAGEVQERLAGGQTSGVTEAHAAERVQSGVRGAARELKQKVDEAYKKVRGEEFAVSPGAAHRLPELVEDRIGDIDITPDLTPAAARAQKVVGELVEAVAEGKGQKFETFRRRLGNLAGSAKNPTDRKATTNIRKAFDEWMDEAIDQELFEGNPKTLEMLKEARSLRREYGKKFESAGRQDTAGKIMDNIVRKAESPEEVANYIFGQSALGRKQDTIKAVKRLKEAVGKDSEAWSAIREMAWLRMTRNRRGEWVGGKAFKKNFEELKNRNKSLMDEMFTKDEQRLMRRFSEAVELTDPPQTNPSGTAFGLENAIRYTLRRFGTRQTFRGDVGKGTILHFMARMRLPFADEALGSRAGSRAASMPSAPQPKAPGFVAGGTAGAQQINEAQRGTPRVGNVEDGYRFKGGDPSKQENWEAVH